ncbi:GATA transcription factor 2-like [Phoenix dactylifera]|uniref:GATA transcription factor 2-like n=1 Tax=Phoenix dactylifera TaxID=42345 RepID=A0A8B7CS82_PHODC|nr:GATA transcription factor 2-like [Phoenix dactylifera]
MDISADTSVSGGGPAGPPLGEFVPGEPAEGGEDVSLEWLSIYMEDCLSGTTSYTTTSQPLPPPTTSHDTPSPKPPQPQNPTKTSSLDDLAIPAKARTKRRRVTTPKALTSQDPLLFFHQTCWLADSELILPKKEQEDEAPAVESLEGGGGGEAGEKIGKELQIRRCSHCLSHKTPQWRAGPLGPKTLCNACGVRFKSGRLLPEYRPAKSPTFVSYKHSNSHKKVMEMRMMAILSSQSN